MAIFNRLRIILQVRQPFSIPPLFIALFIQVIALALVKFIFNTLAIKPSLFEYAVWCGLTASCLSYIARLAWWWLLIQCAFFPALLATLNFNIRPDFFLLLFVVMVLVFWNTLVSRVPLYLSSPKVWHALEAFLPDYHEGASFKFIDIGSGLGGVIVHLAKARPDGSYTGIESAPMPFLWSLIRLRLGRYVQCQVYWGDLWAIDLTPFDVVYAYLSPAPMSRLWQKAKAEMKSGSIFISSTFSVPGETPCQTVTVDDLHQSTLQIWRMP